MRPISLAIDTGHHHQQSAVQNGQQPTLETVEKLHPVEPLHLTPKLDSKPTLKSVQTPTSVTESISKEGDVPIQSVEQLLQARRLAGATLAGRRQTSDGALMRSPHHFDATSPSGGSVKLVGRRVRKRLGRSHRSNSAKDLRSDEQIAIRTPPRPNRKSAVNKQGQKISKDKHEELLKKLKLPTSPEEEKSSITIKQVRQGNKVLLVRRSIKRRHRSSRNDESAANKSAVSRSRSIEPRPSPPIVGSEILINTDETDDLKDNESSGRNWELRRNHSFQQAGESSSSSLNPDKDDENVKSVRGTKNRIDSINKSSRHLTKDDAHPVEDADDAKEQDEPIQLGRKRSVLKTEIEVMEKNFQTAGKYANNCILINQERSSRGLCALQRNVGLDQLASDYARRLAESSGKERITSTYHGNMMRGPSIRAVHAAMMERDKQRSNIINPLFREFGVGTVRKDGTLYVCQLFSESIELVCEDFDS